MAVAKKRKKASKAAPKSKKHNKIKLGKTGAVLAFTAIIATLALQWVEQEKILNRQQERKAALEQQHQQLIKQINDINREIDLSDSPSYIEHYLREKLGMIREGEIMYKVEAPKGSD